MKNPSVFFIFKICKFSINTAEKSAFPVSHNFSQGFLQIHSVCVQGTRAGNNPAMFRRSVLLQQSIDVLGVLLRRLDGDNTPRIQMPKMAKGVGHFAALARISQPDKVSLPPFFEEE